jgi:hypothetical protein
MKAPYLALLLFLTLPLFAWQDALRAKIQRGEPPVWMLEQIQKDLVPFLEKGVSKEMLELALSFDKGDLLLVRFHIKDQKVTYQVAPVDTPPSSDAGAPC